MKHVHVKNGMKKVLAFSLAAAMVIPGMAVPGTVTASAEGEEVTVPKPAKTFSLERGFAADGLTQTKFGGMIGWIEDTYPEGHQYAGLKYFNSTDGRLTGQYKEVDTVLKQGTFSSSNPDTDENGKYHKGYETEKIPEGAKKQYQPDISKDDGSWLQFSIAWNQPTTAHDAEKGMVFWLDDTLVNDSYPTYATTVDWENGTWETDESVIVKDTKGQYMEFGITNSSAEFNSPFVAPVPYETLGDLDGDGNINSMDALAVLKHDVGLELLSKVGQLFADVNGDGKVDSEDALDILKKDVGIINAFTGTAPNPGDYEEEAVADGFAFSTWIKNISDAKDGGESLEDGEFFHVERRVLGKTVNSVTNVEEEDERNIQERQYLYFSGNGVTYVGDFNDPESACTWTLADSLKGDATVNLLNTENRGKWNYVSYAFDGTDFHMYLNGKEATLEKKAGANYKNEIVSFVYDKEAKTYLGGRGGGVKGNFNTYAINTSNDYYMDDIAIYTEKLSAEQAAKAYEDAAASLAAEQKKTANVLKTYSFDGASLAEDQLTAVAGADSKRLPSANEAGKVGKAIKLNKSTQKAHGGAQLAENPFAGRSDLTGVTVSYWMKSIPSRGITVNDGVLISFLDDSHLCSHEKVGSVNARSQLYLNQAFIGRFCEAATAIFGKDNLKNVFTCTPYPYGDPATLTPEYKRQFEIYKQDENGNDVSYYSDWVKLRNSLANDWNFVTVTFTNAGFTMYLNGKEVENKCISFKGERFCDYYWGRVTDTMIENGKYRHNGNNAGARTMMDFLTASDTKVYIGYAYELGSTVNYEKSSECYLDELTFYDKDMTAAEVQALYDSVK